jgi:hypothetical protein
MTGQGINEAIGLRGAPLPDSMPRFADATADFHSWNKDSRPDAEVSGFASGPT